MLLPLQLQLNLYTAPITRDSKGVWTRPDILTGSIGEIAPEWRDLRSRLLLAMNFPHTPDDPIIYDVLTGRHWPITVSGGGTTTVYDENRGYLLEKDDDTRRSTYWADPNPLTMAGSEPRSFSMLCRTAASGVDSQIAWSREGPSSTRYQFFRTDNFLYTRHAGFDYSSITGLPTDPANVIEHWNCSFRPTTGSLADISMWFDGQPKTVTQSGSSLVNQDATVDFGHIGTHGLSAPTFEFRGGYLGAWVYRGVHSDAEALRLYYDPWGPVRWSPKSYVPGFRAPTAVALAGDATASATATGDLSFEGFFDQRTYTSWDTRTVGFLEYSSLAYDERTDQQYFYSMDNGTHTLQRFTRDGCRVGGVVDWSVAGTDDLEGLTFLGPSGWSPPGDAGTYYWAMIEEHDDASPEMLLYFFNMDRDTTSISSAGYTVTITGIETSNEWVGVSGEGAEGVVFDRVAEKFYVGVQNMEDARGGFWEVTPDGDASWAASRLFYWYDVVGPGGENLVPSTAKCGDITIAQSWLTDSNPGRFFVLCNDGVTTGASARIVEFDTSGQVHSSFDYGRDSQNEKWEGIAFDDSTDHDIVIVGEPLTNNWRRFSTRGTLGTTQFQAWQSTWEYSDVDEDYVTSDPRAWDASFDPSSPPDSGTAFSSAAGLFGDPTITGVQSPHTGVDTTVTIDAGDSRSHYFVGEFSLTQQNIDDNAHARIGFVADEGCWIWINSVLIVQYNVASGDNPTSHGQLSVDNVTGNDEGLQRWIEFDLGLCVAGTNRIVAITAQESAANGDIAWDGRFDLLDAAPAALPGGTVSLAGAASAAGTATGDLSVASSVLLAGDANAAGTATGALDVDVQLAADASASATATGALTVSSQIALAGDATATATATGDLDLTVGLASDANAAGTATGDLDLTVSLASDASAAATATGDLSISGAVALAGDANAAGTATGDLTIELTIAGDASAAATATGSLGAKRPLASAASAAGTATGALDITRGIAGDANAVGTATGAIVRTIGLASDANAVATAVGDVIVDVQLAADATAAATATGTLTIQAVFDSGVQLFWVAPTKGRYWDSPDKGRIWTHK